MFSLPDKQQEIVQELGNVEQSLLNWALRPDKALVSWLLGHYHAHAKLGTYAALEWPRRCLKTELLLAGDSLQGLQRAAAEEDPIFVFYGRLAADNGGEVIMQHLLHGTCRELQKMGRMMNVKDQNHC